MSYWTWSKFSIQARFYTWTFYFGFFSYRNVLFWGFFYTGTFYFVYFFYTGTFYYFVKQARFILAFYTGTFYFVFKQARFILAFYTGTFYFGVTCLNLRSALQIWDYISWEIYLVYNVQSTCFYKFNVLRNLFERGIKISNIIVKKFWVQSVLRLRFGS